MANPGTGFRTVNSILAEISLHLLEPLVNTTLSAPIASGLQTATVGSTTAMYVGALLVVDLGSVSVEVVTITAVNPGVSFTATFANSHLAGAVIITPTFPSQQPTDPFFTQTEMLGYLSRAQNEFLARMPSIFQLTQQLITVSQIYQTTPANCVEINRIALSNPNLTITSLTRTGNVVTAVVPSHGLIVGEKFSVLGTTASPLTDATFAGAFSVTSVTDVNTFKYSQAQSNSSSTGGYIGLWTRLYEVSQEELTMQHRDWAVDNKPVPTNWFEDRAGNYRWGIGGVPLSNFPVELLCSIRDTDTLSLTDGFLLPDFLLHYVKYKTLAYVWSKDGVQANPQMARYAQQRFEMGIVATRRWLDGVLTMTSQDRRTSGARR